VYALSPHLSEAAITLNSLYINMAYQSGPMPANGAGM